MKPTNIEDEDEPGFFQRHKVILIVAVLALGGGGWFYMNHKPAKSVSKKKMDMVMVMPVMAPPPPSPPPVKLPDPPPEEKKEDEEAPPEEAPPEDAPPEKVDAPPSEPIGTAIAGGDGSGLGVGGGTGGGGMIGGGGGKNYSERGRWQGKFVREVEASLRRTPELKYAKGRFVFRVWVDEAGRATRVVLNGSTGDPQKDQALQSRALAGQVFDAPPPGTPMPVKLLFNAH